MRPPRVAFFPDSFHEVNGVAHTSRNFVAFAKRRDLPFLCIRAGKAAHGKTLHTLHGNLETLDLARGFTSFRIEKDLDFDPLFWRYAGIIGRTLRTFRPDVIHITGPSELGILGAFYAWRLGIPLVASWHTNVHEYAARRIARLTAWIPGSNAGARVDRMVERTTLALTTRFYRFARLVFAPNRELCRMLETLTGRPCYLMQRGVDTKLFSPTRRIHSLESVPAAPLVLGYVGRLSVEKNIALLPSVARQLSLDGVSSVRFLIVGHGAEEEVLRLALPDADFPGVLRDEALADAYASMDLFLFPSHTDTFGNVVLEALASGVPAIVTPGGGPKYIVRDGETGFVVPDAEFAQAIALLAQDPARLNRMRIAARAYAESCAWDAVFERIYAAYDTLLKQP